MPYYKSNYYKVNPKDGTLWYFSKTHGTWQEALERENPETKEVWTYWNNEWMPKQKALQTPSAYEPPRQVGPDTGYKRQTLEGELAQREADALKPGIASDTAAALLSIPGRQIKRFQSKIKSMAKVLGSERAEQLTSSALPFVNPVSWAAGQVLPDYKAERIAGQAIQTVGDVAGDIAPIAAASAANPLLGAAVAGAESSGAAAENVAGRTDMTRAQKLANVAGHGALGAGFAMIPGGPGAQLERLTGNVLGRVGIPLEQSALKQGTAAGLGTALEATGQTLGTNWLNQATGAQEPGGPAMSGFLGNLVIPGAARLGRGLNVRTPMVPLSERTPVIDSVIGRPATAQPIMPGRKLSTPPGPARLFQPEPLPSIGMRRDVEGGPIIPDYIAPDEPIPARVPPVVEPPMDIGSSPLGRVTLGAPGQPVGTQDSLASRPFLSPPKALLKPSRVEQQNPILYGPAYQATLDAVEERSKFQARHAEPLKAAGSLSRSEMRDLSRIALTPEFRATGRLPEGVRLTPKQQTALSKIVEGNRAMSSEMIAALDDAAANSAGSGQEVLKQVADKFRQFQKDNPGYIRLLREGDWEKRVSYMDPQSGQPVTIAMLRGKSKGDVEGQFKKFLDGNPDIAEAITTQRAMTTEPVKIVRGAYPSNPDASKIARALEDAGMPKEYAADVASAYDDIVLGEGFNRFAAAQKRARFVPGFTEDIGEAYKSSVSLMGNQIVKLGPGRKALEEIGKIGSMKNPQGQPVYGESEQFLKQMYDQAMNNPLARTQAGRLALAARSVNFMRQMGLDPGAAVQQVTQKLTHDTPTMLADYGLRGPGFQLRGNRIATEVLSSPKMKSGAITRALAGEPPKGVTSEEWVKELQDFVKSELDSSLLTSEAMQDLRSYSQSPLLRGVEKATEVGGYIMNKTETHNRLATLIGNYVAARKAGFPVEPGVTTASQLGRSTGSKYIQLAPEEAAVLARKRTGQVNNMGGSINMSAVERTPVGSALTQYRFFPIEYMQQLQSNYKNVAQRYRNMGATEVGAHLAAMGPTGAALSATVASAGTRGIPYLLTAWAAAKGLKDLLPSDAPPSKPVERQIEDFGREALSGMGLKGQELEDMIGLFKRGLPHAVNLELSGRLGLADPLNIKGAQSSTDLALAAAGPTVGTAKDVLGAAGKARAGDITGAAGTLLGRAAGSVAGAIGGEATGKGGVSRKLDARERILKGAGLRTAESGDVSDLQSERFYEENQLGEWANDYGSRIARAYDSGGVESTKPLTTLFKKMVQKLADENRGYAVDLVINHMLNSAMTKIQKKQGYSEAQIKQMIYEAIRNPEKSIKAK